MSGDPYKYFRIECRQLLDALSTGILALESGSAEAPGASDLFRAAHTLKGAARIVRHGAIADASHQLEEYLSPMRATGQVPGALEIQAMLDLLAHIEQALGEIEAPAPPAASPEQPASSEVAPLSWERQAELLSSLREAHAALRQIAVLVDSAERVTATHADGASQLDSSRISKELRHWAEVGQREITDAHEAASRLHHVAFKSLLPALELTVRDVAQVRQKRALVRIQGGELRVAAEYLNRLKPALVQLARNAVAHGIEPSAERERSGKPPIGQVVIGVRRSGRRLLIYCEDDGQGVDFDAVRHAAAKRGLSATITESELLAMLVQTPVSTSTRVDQAAGRGVGLEIVGSVCRELGGSARVSTARGAFTRVELDLPGSLGELDALLVRVHADRYLIPLEQVRKGQLFEASVVTRSDGVAALDVDGRRMKLVDLGAYVSPRPRAARALCVVVTETPAGYLALQVDHIIGIRTVTPVRTRALPLLDPAVSAVTILEDGEIVPILNAEAVGARAPAQPVRTERAERLRVLVVDDSLTSRSLEQSILETAGYLVDTAASAEEGLRRVEEQRYGLCLVDVEMPGADGFSFVRALRANKATAEVPAILISSRNSPSDREAGRQAGAQDYIAKQEFDQNLLLKRIAELTQ